VRQLLRSLLWQFGWRSAVEAILWAARRSQYAQGSGAWPLVFLTLVFTTGPLAMLVLLSYGWWLVTGRGPGLRLFLHDVGGPAQRGDPLGRIIGKKPSDVRSPG
jgi:hypothetical protein